MIVDNNPECFRYDKCVYWVRVLFVANAIPISSWYGDGKDKELLRLLPFLDLMRTVDDVRTVLSLNKII